MIMQSFVTTLRRDPLAAASALDGNRPPCRLIRPAVGDWGRRALVRAPRKNPRPSPEETNGGFVRSGYGAPSIGTAKKTIIAIARAMTKPISSQAQSW